MARNTKSDILAPPKVGVRMLEISLPPTIAEYEIGDIEEEYRARVRQEGIKCAKRWFWIQVRGTLRITIKEDGGRAIFKKAIRCFLPQAGSLSVVAEQYRIKRRLWIAHGTIALILLYLLTPSAFSPLRVELDKQKIQEQSVIEGVFKENAQSSPPTVDQSIEALSPAVTFTATAYSLRGRTASGTEGRRGIIAADRRILPLGTRVRLEAGAYSGEYIVADTGGAVRGRKIDIWVPLTSESMRFGRRPVKLTVLTRTRPRTTSPFNDIKNETEKNIETKRDGREVAL